MEVCTIECRLSRFKPVSKAVFHRTYDKSRFEERIFRHNSNKTILALVKNGGSKTKLALSKTVGLR